MRVDDKRGKVHLGDQVEQQRFKALMGNLEHLIAGLPEGLPREHLVEIRKYLLSVFTLAP